jgi:8-oxo-dGTP pyrophosphatase MutT (NUDIX family)
MNSMKTRMEISAGGVVFRRDGNSTQVCLIMTQGGKAWQLPKGIIEPGEAPEVAAKREVSEETGLLGELVRTLDKIEYWYVWTHGGERARIHKLVYFYLFRYVSGSTNDHDHEVDDARWLPLDEALKLLSFENERRILGLARKAIEEERTTG